MAWTSRFSSELQGIAQRVVGSLFALVGCLFGLSISGVTLGWKLEFAYAFLSLGLICIVEISWRWRPLEDVPAFSSPPPPWDMSEPEKKERWEKEEAERKGREEKSHYEKQAERERRRTIGLIKSLIELVLLIGLAVLTALLGRNLTLRLASVPVQPPVHDQGQNQPPIKMQHTLQPTNSDDGSKLSSCQSELGNAKAELEKCKAAVDLEAKNSDLLKKILDSLNHPANPPIQPPPSGFNFSWGELFIAGIVLGAIVLVARKHKEAVPVAGAAGLAMEAIKHGNELAKMNEYLYGRVLYVFLGVSVVLTILFLIAGGLKLYSRAATQPADPHAAGNPPPERGWFQNLLAKIFRESEDQSKSKEDYISSLGFSVLVLLWAVVMVGYRVQENNSPKAGTTPSTNKYLASKQLKALRPFVEGHEELENPSGLESWKESIARDLRQGETLLLLGSTDCKPFRKGGDGDNPSLAGGRARQVSEWLKQELEARGVRVEVDSVDQHERCRQSKDMRAVYPFRIYEAQP